MSMAKIPIEDDGMRPLIKAEMTSVVPREAEKCSLSSENCIPNPEMLDIGTSGWEHYSVATEEVLCQTEWYWVH